MTGDLDRNGGVEGGSDAAARAAIRTDLASTVVVEAAAGTGKTTELVQRIVAVLADGRAQVDGIVAVTFTEKAAGELKLRLRSALEAARRQGSDGFQRRHVERALARLEEARVNTIHGFCADLLRERPVEARVDPQFQVLTEADAERLFRSAFSAWLTEVLADPPEGVRRSLRRRARDDEDGGAVERLRRAAWQLAEWRDFPASWRRDPFDRAAALDALARDVTELAALTERCANPARDPLYRDTAPVRRLRDRLRRAAGGHHGSDDDGLEAALVDLVSPPDDLRRATRGAGRFYFKELPRTVVDAARRELCTALEAFKAAADADLAAALHGELRGAVERYQTFKQRAGVLDFVDLLLRARDLIRDAPAVRADFQRRFTHLFVDEFQDTDPLQAEILLLLAADDPAIGDWRSVQPVPGKLFIVGDPKQSIYRFRRADLGTYLEVTALLAARGARCVRLTTSFRARPAMQRFVNAAFAPQMTADPDALQPGYVPLAPWREAGEGQPAVVALPVPEPYGARAKVTKAAIERSLPDAVGAFVAWLVQDSGWTVTERDGDGCPVPVAPRHVCLLFRRLIHSWSGTDMSRDYVRALEARAIPHLLVGGKSFHAREEVETMRAALTAIEWPDDELAVFATLRGSLFAIGDDELFLYRHAHRRVHPFRVPADLPEAWGPIGEALHLLADLHRHRNRRPVADTIARLLEVPRAHAGFALRPSGEQALANVLHIAELARAYESGGSGLSFRGFVERLLDDAERAQTSEAPILEEGSEGVRIMTVHKAKGLEFPVVVLADMTAKLTGAVSRWIHPARRLCAERLAGWMPAELAEHSEDEAGRDRAESLRITYVAATRARDLLVVPALGDERFEDGWVSGLNGALYPAPGQWRRATPAPGCPRFGGECTSQRPAELAFTIEGVMPGEHRFEGYGVTWWAPDALQLKAPAKFGLRQRELLDKRADPELLGANRRQCLTWEASRAAALAAGAVPSLRVTTATAAASTAPGGIAGEVELIEIPARAGRPAGPRFGALVHAVLATVPLTAPRAAIAEVAALQSRLLGATAGEEAASVELAAATLAHPLLERARASGACRRETPVTVLGADATLVEGSVDLAYLDGDRWVVIDFKTDQELAERLDVYRRQVSLYAAAITVATGRPVRPILLRV